MSEHFVLAGSDVSIPRLGVGTWSWGDRDTWGMGGYDKGITCESIYEAWIAAIDAGVILFDTAEIYGRGESERILGTILARDPVRAAAAVIATKFLPLRRELKVREAMLRSINASLSRLGLRAVDLYQIHSPTSSRSQRVFADALAAVVEAGLTKAVGVSNYSAAEMRSIHSALQARGLRLASNQIEYSLLRTDPETNGVLSACKELGIVPLAYSPLGQGRLSGKYSESDPPRGNREFGNHPMKQVEPIVAELHRIGQRYGGKTPSQVALNWVIVKGAVPIPGAKNAQQAKENAGALGWRLDDDDVKQLDRLALPGVLSLRRRLWQHG